MNESIFIHELSDVQSVDIGEGTSIWQFCVILKHAKIGDNCNINANVFIENKVVIGDNTTIKCGVQVWDGVTIGKNVFIGPNVTFTNDLTPRSKVYSEEYLMTEICDNVSIGANATILPGLSIGKYALVAAGAVVTKDVPSRALVLGNPARIVGWVNEDGSKMNEVKPSKFLDSDGSFWTLRNSKIERDK